MKHATCKGLKMWEIGLNDMFYDCYRTICDPLASYERCFETIAELRGFATALLYTNIITSEEKHLIHEEIRSMIDLIFDLKLKG